MTYFAVNELANAFCNSDRGGDSRFTYSVPEVPVPAGLLALILHALRPRNTISRDTEHL